MLYDLSDERADTAESGRADTGELARSLHDHVTALAAAPRHRRCRPTQLSAPRAYVTDRLSAAGWSVRAEEFTVPAGVGLSDAGFPSANLWPLRLRRSFVGTNLLATRGGPITRDTLVVIAHLDSVRNSPGADDNASGVAAILAAASHIPPASGPRNVALILADLEEISMAGSHHLARTLTPGAVLNLESVGYYDPAPGTQKLPPGLSLLAGGLAAEIRDRNSAGDFALVVHRKDSSELARGWAACAQRAGLATVLFQDNRYTGRGYRVERLVDVIGANLDRSDHAPFWNANVPSVMVTDTAPLRNPHYHRPSDTAGTLDYDRLAAVTLATAELAREWQTTSL